MQLNKSNSIIEVKKCTMKHVNSHLSHPACYMHSQMAWEGYQYSTDDCLGWF